MADNDDTTEESNVDPAPDADETTKADGDGKADDTPVAEAEQLRKAKAALKKANAEAAAHRKELADLRKKNESDAEAQAREAKEQAAKDAEAVWKPKLIAKAVKAGLAEAGYNGDLDVAKRLLDLDAIELDDDGEIDGLADQIKKLKKEFPEKFSRKGGSAIDGADRGGGNGGLSADDRRILADMSKGGL